MWVITEWCKYPLSNENYTLIDIIGPYKFKNLAIEATSQYNANAAKGIHYEVYELADPE